jgi:hypothetical protein
VFAQFAGPKIQLENPKKEPPAELMGFFHREEAGWEREVYHQVKSSGTRSGDSFL